MTDSVYHPLLNALYRNTNVQFWLLQIVGWFGLSLVSFLSLNLWYNQQDTGYIAHTLVQSALGVLVSWPLRSLFHYFWNDKLIFRLSSALAGIIGCSLIWSILRISTFMAMTGEKDVWADFGGWLFGSFLIFLSWVAFYHLVKYYQLLQNKHETILKLASDTQTEQVKRLQAETVAREAQLKMLRYQLNPHFLFNTLNAVSALVAVKEATKAREMIDKLSSFLRYSLKDERKEAVKLQEEIEALDLYLSIEKTRFSDRLSIHYNIDEAVLNARVPSLILQPLAENAIKYAISLSERGGVITVAAARKGDNLVVSVTDDGLGIGALGAGVYTKNAFSFGGVGIQNIHDRLENIYGQDGYEMNLYNKLGEGLKVELIFRFERVA